MLIKKNANKYNLTNILKELNDQPASFIDKKELNDQPAFNFMDNYDKKFYLDFKNTYDEYTKLYNNLANPVIKDNKIIIPNYDNIYSNFNFNKKKNNVKKLYNTELLLISNSTNIKNLLCWIFWHKKIIKFEHIVLIYNNDTFNIPVNVIKKIDPTIEIIKKSGTLCQAKIYTEYVNKSKAQWILPLDDDEFLYIPDQYDNNINTFIASIKTKTSAAKYAFLCHFYFNDTLLLDDNDYYLNTFKYVCSNGFFDLCCSNIFLFTVKTIVNTDYNHLYIVYLDKPEMEYNLSTFDINYYGEDLKFCQQMGSVHNPITKYMNYFYNAYSIEKNYTIPAMTFHTDGIDNSGNVPFVAHYKYTTVSSYMKKINNFKFTDVIQSYRDSEYNVEFINKVYNKIKPYLTESDILFKLFQENNGDTYINGLI